MAIDYEKLAQEARAEAKQSPAVEVGGIDYEKLAQEARTEAQGTLKPATFTTGQEVEMATGLPVSGVIDSTSNFIGDAYDTVTNLPETVGNFATGVKKAFTGEDQTTPEIEATTDWNHMPELIEFGNILKGLGVTASTVLTNPQETAQILKANYPDLPVRQDSKGNFIFTSKLDGKDYGIQPGFGTTDIPRLITAGLAFTPAGRATTLTGSALAGAGTQAAIEGGQALMGGDFNPEEVLIEGAMGPAGMLVSKGAGKLRRNAPGVGSVESKNLVIDGQEVNPVQGGPDVVDTSGGLAPGPSMAGVAEDVPTASMEEIGLETKKMGRGSKKSAQKVAEMSAQDPEVVQAAKDLGIEDYLQSDHTSTSQSYREIQQAIKSQPGSILREEEMIGLEKVGKRANDLIEELGGSDDLSTVNVEVKNKLDKITNQIRAKESKAFNTLKEAIPEDQRATPQKTLDYLEQEIDNVEGFDNLSPIQKEVYKKLKRETGEVAEEAPKYSLIDNIRKKVGKLSQKSSMFGDEESGIAKKLYGLLAEDQSDIAESLGLDKQRKIANLYTKARKGIEDDTMSLYGKKLDKSIVQPLMTGIKSLEKGDVSKFINVIKSIPKSQRKSVVASSLKTAFGKSIKNGDLNFNTYSRWFKGVKDKKQAYLALSSNLPEGSMKKLNDLYLISDGIKKATDEYINTGRLAEAKKYLEQADTFARKTWEATKQASKTAAVAEGIGSLSGIPFVGGTSGFAYGIGSALQQGKKDILGEAQKVMKTQEFKNAVKESVKGKVSPETIKKLSKTAQMKNLSKNLNLGGMTLEQWLLTAMRATRQYNNEENNTNDKEEK